MNRFSASLISFLIVVLPSSVQAAEFLSHTPVRPLPAASKRPLAEGPSFYVHPVAGDDSNAGSKQQPWKTSSHAVKKLNAGDTLYLHGGVYYEHPILTVKGTAAKPITVRSVPGELAVIDGGLREFFERPQTCWEPVANGAPGEYRSAKTYPDLGGSAGGTNLLGNFGDSMIPLHGYRFITDLRNTNEYFANLDDTKTAQGNGIYCGPGLFYDLETERIHVRLAHTTQRALGTDNYTGETDPRKLSLIIAGLNAGSALTLQDSRYLKLQDIVVRGARHAALQISDCANIELDGVTAYGGSAAIRVNGTGGLRLWNCACRGIAAPWTYRGHLKYRAIEARIFSASGWDPTARPNHDFEMAYSEFTDCVDGIFIGNVRNVNFHHNLVDNVSDDGFFLTATTDYDGNTPGGNVRITQNLISRCLTAFAFGVGHGRQKWIPTGRQAGSGVIIARNIFDFRRPVMYQQPKEGEPQITTYGRVAGDHGGPLWEPMTIFHNTIVQADAPWRHYYMGPFGQSLATGSRRRVFNNLKVQQRGQVGSVFPEIKLPVVKTAEAPKKVDPLDALIDNKPATKPIKKPVEKVLPPIDFQADGNLQWSFDAELNTDPFHRFRNSTAFEASKQVYKPGWVSHDLIANPKLTAIPDDWNAPGDYRLKTGSPAINAGVELPENWDDPLQKIDNGKPDLGAIPAGVSPWRIAQQGRLLVFGSEVNSPQLPASPEGFLLSDSEVAARDKKTVGSAMIVEGYPAFDAPLLQHAFQKAGFSVDGLERTWLPAEQYQKYDVVVQAGSFPRAKMEPNKFSEADLEHLESFLVKGGTLMLMRGNRDVFSTPHGKQFLYRYTGSSRAEIAPPQIVSGKHEWLSHFDETSAEWVKELRAAPIRVSKGETILGTRDGLAVLYRVKIGQGQLIVVGWDIASSLPSGRARSTPEKEAIYEQQMQILNNIIESLTPAKN